MGARSSKITSQNNRSDGHLLEYFRNTFVRGGGGTNAAIIPSYTYNSGGIISTYESGGTYYRAHIFTTTGSLVINDPSPRTADILVVGAGGGGGTGGGWAGGGGGGGLLEGTSVPLTPGTYPITIGAGGNRSVDGNVSGSAGGNSVWNGSATALGGGGGAGSFNVSGQPAGGGSGGGAGENGTAEPGVQGPSGGFTGYGNNGAAGGPNQASGGAGAGGSPTPYSSKYTGTLYKGNNSTTPAVASDGNYQIGGNGRPNSWATGSEQFYAGGGGAGSFDYNNADGRGWGAWAPGYTAPPHVRIDTVDGQTGTLTSPANGGGGGAGVGYWRTVPLALRDGLSGTGGGGGGGLNQGSPDSPVVRPAGAPVPDKGGNGGSGIIVVRYAIPSSSGTAKATGGAISYYGGYTIHTFTGSGTFATAPNWTATNVEYVVVAGGGGGANNHGGGGGAGGYRTGTTPVGAHPVSTVIQVGGGGEGGINPGTSGGVGTDSYFGTPITSTRGGGGAGDPGTAQPGGSGGGGHRNGGPGSGNTPFVAPPQGNPGGTSSPSSGSIGGSGGGGAGSPGFANSGSNGGHGGTGIQLPTTFQDPNSTVGYPGPSGTYWLSGGGGGGAYSPATGGSGGGPGGPYAGAAPGGSSTSQSGTDAKANSGSGGGGGAANFGKGGYGGSGIVIIAYPST